MPQTPEDLSKIIREMAQRHAKELGKVLTAKAEDRIATIPAPYSQQTTITVELKELDAQIWEIMVAASLAKQQIDLPEMEEALRKVKCHYLWLC